MKPLRPSKLKRSAAQQRMEEEYLALEGYHVKRLPAVTLTPSI